MAVTGLFMKGLACGSGGCPAGALRAGFRTLEEAIPHVARLDSEERGGELRRDSNNFHIELQRYIFATTVYVKLTFRYANYEAN